MADLDKCAPDRTPAFQIDFSKTVDDNIFYPITAASKSKSIKAMARNAGKSDIAWDAEAVNLVDAQISLYSDIPMLCLGRKVEKDAMGKDTKVCEFACFCPFSEAKVEEDFKGCNCPVEVYEAFKLFAGYVVDLEIRPTDFVDLQAVVDIVRLHLQIRRMDLYQKAVPVWELKLAGINQNTGDVYHDRKINIALEQTEKLRKDMDLKYKQLIATRAEKLKADSLAGDQLKDMATYIGKLQGAAEKAKKLKSGSNKALKASNAIDAEFSVSENGE